MPSSAEMTNEQVFVCANLVKAKRVIVNRVEYMYTMAD